MVFKCHGCYGMVCTRWGCSELFAEKTYCCQCKAGGIGSQRKKVKISCPKPKKIICTTPKKTKFSSSSSSASSPGLHQSVQFTSLSSPSLHPSVVLPSVILGTSRMRDGEEHRQARETSQSIEDQENIDPSGVSSSSAATLLE